MKKSKKAPARKPAKRSTALAVRPKVRMRIADPNGVLDQRIAGVQLTDLATSGGIGLARLVLTKAERAIILRPVERVNVSLLPDGTAYLPHIHYTRWLNEAFGPTTWALVPAARPLRVENLIIQDFHFYVHGAAVAYVRGGAEYHEKNRRQTYDDVLEATFAYGLRRACKRLGMALELWDKRWLYAFMLAEGIQVKVRNYEGKISEQWRRRIDPPLPGEVPAGTKSKTAPAKEEPSAGDDGNNKDKISNSQVKRLVGIWRQAGRNDNDVRLWLNRKYGYTGTADIKRFDYDRIERELMARGELVLPGDE